MKIRNIIILFSAGYSMSLAGQVKDSTVAGGSQVGLFESDELINASIYLDMAEYQRKNLNGKSIDGKMVFHLSPGDSLEKNIKISHRGIFRQQYCSFPPMEITFSKPVSAYAGKDGFKKLKLVTHCDPGKGSDDYVLREYLAYRLFNILTDTSYRVRLLRITYIDTDSKRKPMTYFGFCIEPADVLAKRVNMMRLKDVSVTQKDIIPGLIDRISIFNYMIGNYDWAVPNQHNIHIFKSLDFSQNDHLIAVTYDFDFTGFVNPYYAVPTDETGLKSVRQRIFTGICRTESEFREAILKISGHEKEMTDLINGSDYLLSRSKTDLVRYLEEFLGQTASEADLRRLIETLSSTCKKL